VIKRAPDDGPAYRKFVGATYEASVLTRDEDYTAASGSLILTLQPDFLETLDPGDHTVNVYFSDVAETDPVPVTFTVAPVVYTVSFSANGHGTAPAAQTVTEGNKATKPANPTAAGYTFGGWYTEAQCRNVYDFDTPVTENLTLYAKWTANSSGSGTSGSSSSSSTRSSYVSGPKTGDPGRTGLWAVVLLISMAGLSGAAAAYGRSRRKEKPAVQAGQNEGGQEAD